jgi:uncharacterized protein (DUF58 family)
VTGSGQASGQPTGDSRIPALLRSIRILELAARENAAGLLSGDYLTSIRGQGMIFHESRKYVAGEPVRSIDWNVTARLGEPYVKVNLEERQRDVIVALDVSPSMHTGFQDKTKLEFAVELAATLGATAIDGGDRLGWVLFADQALEMHRPQGGNRQLFRFLRALLQATRPWRRPVDVSDPRTAVHAIQAAPRGRFVVFLISDFIDHDVPDDLKYLRPRHDVSLLHVYDPAEFAIDSSVVFGAHAPEGPASGASGRTLISPGEPGSLDEIQGFLRHEAQRYKLAFGSFSTAMPVAGALGEFFHRKRGLTVR